MKVRERTIARRRAIAALPQQIRSPNPCWSRITHASRPANLQHSKLRHLSLSLSLSATIMPFKPTRPGESIGMDTVKAMAFGGYRPETDKRKMDKSRKPKFVSLHPLDDGVGLDNVFFEGALLCSKLEWVLFSYPIRPAYIQTNCEWSGGGHKLGIVCDIQGLLGRIQPFLKHGSTGVSHTQAKPLLSRPYCLYSVDESSRTLWATEPWRLQTTGNPVCECPNGEKGDSY